VSELDDLIARLDAIVSDLDEIAFDRLREAMADGQRGRPAADKTLVQARRATEKAAHLLRSLDGRTLGDEAP
jgi:hypothetical protein